MSAYLASETTAMRMPTAAIILGASHVCVAMVLKGMVLSVKVKLLYFPVVV